MLQYELPIDDIAHVQHYDYPTILEAFHHITNFSQLPFTFPQGGCQQRSHLMSMMLSKKLKLEHFKVWIFAPAALFEGDGTAMFIEDKNGIYQNTRVDWNFHTAPALKWNNKGKIEYLVIDPSINDEKPLPVLDWLNCIGNSTKSKYTFLTSEKYFFNCKYNSNFQLTTIFDGSFFEFENPAKDNLVLEKGLAVNDMALNMYSKYILPLKNKEEEASKKRLYELSEIFQNASALDLLFTQNESAYTDVTTHRYVMTHYSDIMLEASQKFQERLVYWTKTVNELL